MAAAKALAGGDFRLHIAASRRSGSSDEERHAAVRPHRFCSEPLPRFHARGGEGTDIRRMIIAATSRGEENTAGEVRGCHIEEWKSKCTDGIVVYREWSTVLTVGEAKGGPLQACHANFRLSPQIHQTHSHALPAYLPAVPPGRSCSSNPYPHDDRASAELSPVLLLPSLARFLSALCLITHPHNLAVALPLSTISPATRRSPRRLFPFSFASRLRFSIVRTPSFLGPSHRIPRRRLKVRFSILPNFPINLLA